MRRLIVLLSLATACGGAGGGKKKAPRSEDAQPVPLKTRTADGPGTTFFVCRDAFGRVESATLWALVEGNERWRLDPHPIDANDAVTRWERLDPERARALSERITTFARDSVALPGVMWGIPGGCAIEQGSVQKEPAFARDAFHTLSSDILDALPPEERALVPLAEAMLRELAEPVAARYVTALLLSTSLDALSDAEYDAILHDLSLDRLANGAAFDPATKLLAKPFATTIGGAPFTFAAGHEVVFDASGAVTSGWLAEPAYVKVTATCSLWLEAGVRPVSFDADGHLASARLEALDASRLCLPAVTARLDGAWTFEFFPSGLAKRFLLWRTPVPGPQELPVAGGVATFCDRTSVEMHETGFVARGTLCPSGEEATFDQAGRPQAMAHAVHHEKQVTLEELTP